MRLSRSASSALKLLSATLVLAACGGSPATPPAAPAATTAPAAPAATTAPATAVPTAAPVAAQATTAPQPTASSSATTDSGAGPKPLPADAAPEEYQTFVIYTPNDASFLTMDQMHSVYTQGGFGSIANVLGDTLVKLNKDFELQPAAALKWSSNANATEWTFELDPNLVWSDGTPLTADDYVATYRHAADPKTAWDFAWYYSAPGAIKGWDDAVAGKIPTDQIGVKATGPHTLVITTDVPAPYFPAKAVYSTVMQKKALETVGPLYNSDPKTSVSAGPFVLKEWTKDVRIVMEANPTYRGSNRPYLRKIIQIFAKPETMFAGYQANEVDYVHSQALQTADIEIIAKDPELSKEVRLNFGDFRTDYLYFDTKKPPFDNLKVRQAFGHIVDRATLIKNILGESQAIPAYSFLAPGFPGANSDGLKDIQSYDPDKARALLAEAGFPGGKGFPKLTMWLRSESTIRQSLAQAIAATIKQELGIEVETTNKDFKEYMAALNAKPTEIQFGMVSYGMDFLDPSNMLGVWLGTGRHNWQNAEYDKMVNTAAENPNQTERIKQFQDAEKLLVTDAPGVFIVHRTRGDLLKPWIKGSELEKNKAGYAAMQWPDFSSLSTVPGSMYVGKEVLAARTSPPK